MKVSDFRLFLCGSLVVFFGGLGLQLSLFHQISRQQRNTTARNNNVSQQQHKNQPPLLIQHPPLPVSNTGGQLLHPVAVQQGPNSSISAIPINYGRCAINLWGLPRAFESLVLPSLIKNVIRGESSCSSASSCPLLHLLATVRVCSLQCVIIFFLHVCVNTNNSQCGLPLRLLCTLLQLDA